MLITAVTAGMLGTGLGAAALRQRTVLSRMVQGVTDRAAASSVIHPPSERMLALPAPVRRYLDHVLPADRRGLVFARYRQRGELRTDAMKDAWMPFSASQVMAPQTGEFIWVARARVAPLVHVQVTDALVAGVGSGRVLLESVVPVGGATGGAPMNAGALHRFLAEAVWYPSALLPSRQLGWQAIDDSTALATLTLRGTTVSLEFRFNHRDEVTGIYTPARWGRFGDGFRQAGWEGKFRRYERVNGILVPREGEVGWHLEGAWRPVWRGTVTSAELEFQ